MSIKSLRVISSSSRTLKLPPGPDQRMLVQVELCHFCFLHKGSCLLGHAGASVQAPILAERLDKV